MGVFKIIAAIRARAGKIREVTVRSLAKWSRQGTQRLFSQSHQLRKFAMGGALLGLGLVLVLAFIYDKLRARAQRHFIFVNRNFDTAARSWKRKPERETRVLRRYFWPVYQPAIHARDIHPPYHDEESFLALASAAVDSDVPMLEGRNADGQASRIPFRQAQRLFASPPFTALKNSVNDLRFSWYRDIRDRHLHLARYILDFTQSAPFENFLLLGFRRDLMTAFSRGLQAARSGVRLEDLVGTSDPSLVPPEIATDRDRIRAYAARKVIPSKLDARDPVWRILVDGMNHAVREIALADPIVLTGEAFREDREGKWTTKPCGIGLLKDLEELEARFCNARRKPPWDLEKLKAARQQARALNERLLTFCAAQDPDREHVQDLGDLRAVRMALQIDKKLRKEFERNNATESLLSQFGAISRNQADYDRALIELRGVYASSLADFELYHEFIEETLAPFLETHPDADFDPWYAKIFPVIFNGLRNAWRNIRQRLQSG